MIEQRELEEYSVEIERYEEWREGSRREVIARLKVDAVDVEAAILVGEAIEHHIQAHDRSASFHVKAARVTPVHKGSEVAQ